MARAARKSANAKAGSSPQLETLVSTASDAIMTIDEASLILSFNPAAERIFGYQAAEIIGQKLTRLMPERFRASHENGLGRYLRTGQRNISWQSIELPGLTKTGEEIPLEISFGEYIGTEGRVFTGIARDISDRVRARAEREELLAREKAAREHAQSADRAKSQFLATMSHEIRTPINAIVGYADLLHAGIGGQLNDAQSDYLDRIRISTQHLLMLINDILDLSKVEAGQLEVARDRGDVYTVMDEALRLIRPQVEAKHLSLIEKCDHAQAAYYVGDVDRVRQILLNLLSNATKFTEAGSITVSCGSSTEIGKLENHDVGPRCTWIRVEDTGPGIAPDQMQRIFQAFVQADNTNTRRHGGTGLGLAISRRLAWLMGGELTAESELGKGSAFTLWLPRERAPAEHVLMREGKSLEARAIVEVGEKLIFAAQQIVRELVRRLRADPDIPLPKDVSDVDLADHASTLLVDMGESLVAAGAADGDPVTLLRDGTAIQRFVADLHGAQRHRLGFTAAAVRREFEILRIVISATLSQELNLEGRSSLTRAVDTIHRMLAEAERMSVLGWRRSSSLS